jgi:SAM-dependent methyltransferase
VKPLATFHSPERVKEYITFYKHYAQNAAAYWANTDRPDYEAEWWMHENRNEISVRLLSHIPDLKEKRILGVGAAHIVDEKLFESMDINLTKIDICGSLGGNNIIEMDACDMSFDDESFDVIICREVIEHVLDDRALLAEMGRVLKHGGWMHITTPNGLNMLPSGQEHLRAYTPVGFIDTLKNFGFRIIAKEGNPPNIFHTLLPMAMAGQEVKRLLIEFKNIADIMRGNEWSYYLSSMLMLLAQKE